MINRMMTFLLTAFVCAFMMAGFAAPVFAQSEKEFNATLDELFGQHKPYQTFFVNLKKAVAADDRQAVAGMVDYPITVELGGKDVTMRSAHDLAKQYDRVFTQKIVTAVQRQTYETLFANNQGVMIGDGEIWFGGICSDEACKHQAVRIISINSGI